MEPSQEIQEDFSLDLLESFMKIYETEEEKLPYHVNLLDLIRSNRQVDENAHSRILWKLLSYRADNGFEILKRFVQLLNGKNPNFKFEVKNPELTNEQQRIDLWIKEKGEYALIVENKVHNAVDQPHQLAHYIEKAKGSGFENSKIYIIYLTRDGTKTPENHAWELNEGTSYKAEFESRFLNLSFRNDILPWLKESIIPNCRIKDNFLHHALEQYIDHLEGMFDLRLINKKMNMELQNFIKTTLKLQGTPEENLTILLKKREELNKVIAQIDLLREEEEQKKEYEYWEKWEKQLEKEYPGRTTGPWNDDDYPGIGVVCKRNGHEFTIAIEKENSSNSIYYGISKQNGDEKKIDEISEWLKQNIQIIPLTLDNKYWYGWEDTNFEEGFNKLKSLIDKVVNLLKQDN